MSTSIRNGIRFPSRDIARAFAILDGLRERVRAAAHAGMHAAAAHELFDLADRAAIGAVTTRVDGVDVIPEEAPIEMAMSWWSREAAGVTQNDVRSPHLDWRCEVMLLPRGPELLGIVYTEQEALLDIIMAAVGIEDCAWDNQCDRPDGVSAKEWARREAAWTAALAPRWRPRECGMLVPLADAPTRVFPRVADLLPLQPSLESRLDRLAREREMDERTAAAFPDGFPDIARRGTSAIVHAMLASRDWIDTPEGQAAVARRRDAYAFAVPESWTVSLLRQSARELAADGTEHMTAGGFGDYAKVSGLHPVDGASPATPEPSLRARHA